MKYLLHIDTSTDIGTVAIGGDGELVAQRVNHESRNHASTLNIMVDEVLEEANITLDQLSGIVVCAGPGSYTGLRIGMATAKGYCYALDKPLLLDNRLTLLAYRAYTQHQGFEYYAVMIKARESEYFICIYNKSFVCTMEPQHILEADLNGIFEKIENIYITTDAPESVIYDLKVNNSTIDYSILIDVTSWLFYGFDRYKCNDIVNLATAEPFYLKQVYTHK